MMNKFLLFIPVLILFLSCGKLGDNGFLVKGKIANSEGKTIFLSEIIETGMVTVDSVKLAKDGEFKLKGNTSYPKFYLLRFSPNEYITLLVDSASILTVTADANDFINSYKVEGSEDMILMKQLADQMKQTQSQIDSLGKAYELFIGTSSLDSAKTEIDRQFNEIVNKQRAFSKQFVEKHPQSMSSLVALSQQIIPQRLPVFSVIDDMAYFEKVDAALFKLYSQSQDVKSLHGFIERAKSKTSNEKAAEGYKIGDMVPDISLSNPEGKILSLYSLRGKYVLLDFWAGWCKPCRQENPNLVENYKKYKNKGFEIFQVSLDKEKSRWLDAIEKDQLSGWLHVSDLQFWQSAPARAYNITQIPANFLLDPTGKVIAVNLRGEALGNKLAEIFR